MTYIIYEEVVLTKRDAHLMKGEGCFRFWDGLTEHNYNRRLDGSEIQVLYGHDSVNDKSSSRITPSSLPKIMTMKRERRKATNTRGRPAPIYLQACTKERRILPFYLAEQRESSVTESILRLYGDQGIRILLFSDFTLIFFFFASKFLLKPYARNSNILRRRYSGD